MQKRLGDFKLQEIVEICNQHDDCGHCPFCHPYYMGCGFNVASPRMQNLDFMVNVDNQEKEGKDK